MVGKALLYGCGNAIVSLQWLTWFSGESFGSFLAPHLASTPQLQSGCIAIEYLAFVALAATLAGYSKRLRSLQRSSWVLTLGTALLVAGNVLGILVSLWDAPLPLTLPAIALLRIGLSVHTFAWGEYYCALGPAKTCVVLPVGYMLAAVSFAIINAIAGSTPFAGAILGLLLIPLSHYCLARGWKWLDEDKIQPKETPANPLNLKKAAPALTAVLVLGLCAGSFLELANFWSESFSPLSWTIGTVIASIAILAALRLRPDPNFGACLNGASLLMVAGLLLLPLFWNAGFGIACIIVFATYSSVSIFSQVAYVSFFKSSATQAMPLVICFISAETLGIAIGQSCFGTIDQLVPLSFEGIYLISLALAALLFASFRNPSAKRLLNPPASASLPGTFDEQCELIARKENLTKREAELLKELAEGFSATEIAERQFISVATVRTHTRNIYKKIGVHSQAELIRYVLRKP